MPRYDTNRYRSFIVRLSFNSQMSAEDRMQVPDYVFEQIPDSKFKFKDFGILLFIASHPKDSAIDLTRGGKYGAETLSRCLARLLSAGLIEVPEQSNGLIHVKKKIPDALRWQVWERDNFTCRQCGTRRFLSVDHIKPERSGGTLELENLQTLCRRCNSIKGAWEADHGN